MNYSLLFLTKRVFISVFFLFSSYVVFSAGFNNVLFKEENLPDSVYLMSYFKASGQHLFYSYSTDALTWVDINNSKPVFDAYNSNIWLRDPYLKRVIKDGVAKFHLVHTWGWDNPAIFHWESSDLITWKAANGGITVNDGKVFVMDGKNGNASSKNAWAPEFTYDSTNDVFYIYWTSDNGSGYLQHHYCTTKDWVTFTPSSLLFDPGFTAIDLTVLKYNNIYYGFYKDERDGQKRIRLATTSSLDPGISKFSGTTVVFPDYNTAVEGPEIFKAIGEDKWFLYWDKFVNNQGVSFATNNNPSSLNWSFIPDNQIKNPSEVRHGSVEIISKDELIRILNQYNLAEEIIVPIADVSLQDWKYSITAPPSNWNTLDFNDQGWSIGKSGFGSAGTPNVKIGTNWTGNDIWLRKSFNPGNLSQDDLNNIHSKIFHDEGTEVYINGVLAFSVTGYVTDYIKKEISEAAKNAIIMNGNNILAAHCHQTWGGQFIDLGIYTLKNTSTSYIPINKTVDFFYYNSIDKRLTLYSNIEGSFKLNLFDIFGRILMSSKNTKSVDVSSLSSGMYIVAFETDNHKMLTGRMIK